MKKKTKKTLKKILTIISIILIIILIGLILYTKVYKKNNSPENKLLGTWTMDGVTTYKFESDNSGELILPLSTYKFDYKIEDNKLTISFVDKKPKTSKYEYTFEKDKLILNSEKGKFTFKKTKDKEKK